MNLFIQNWVVAVVLTGLIVTIAFLLGKYYFRRRYTYLNNVKDLALHPDNYRLYFLVLGIFFPATEIFIEIFKVRAESELISNLVFGAGCIALFYFSRSVRVLKNNMHRIFLGFYIIYSIFIYYNISLLPTDLPTMVEFTLVVMFANYAFYDVRAYFFYVLASFIVLLGMHLSGLVGIKFLVLYYNIILVATAFNYAKYIIDLNIRKNLFWAYNVVNNGSLLVVGIHKKGTISFISENVKTILGYTKEELINKPWPGILADHPATIPPESTAIPVNRTVLQKIICKTGRHKLIEWQEDAVYEDLTIKVGRDVTAISEAEEGLRQTNDRLHVLLTSSGEFVFVLNRNLIFIEYYNYDKSAEQTSRPASFFIGKHISEIGYAPDSIALFSDAVARALATRGITYTEVCLQIGEQKIWFSIAVSTPYNEQGEANEIICVARNITERKQSEIEFKRLNALHQTLLDNVPGYIFCKDYDGRFIFVSKSVGEAFGRNPVDIIGTTDYEYASDQKTIDHYLRDDRYVIDTGESLSIAEEPNFRRDGSPGIFQTLKVPVEIAGSEKRYVFGVSIDITDRKQIEDTLIANQQELLYKSEILAAIAKATEKILISKNIRESLIEIFPIIGQAIKADRVYFFENDLPANRISQKIEWTNETVSIEIKNANLQNLSFADFGSYLTPLLQNSPLQCIVSELEDSKMKQVLEAQNILSLLVLPIFIKNNFCGFIGFDDCKTARTWSADELNILQSLATNIANGIERVNNERIIHENEHIFRQINETIEDVFWLYDILNSKYIYISPSCEKLLGVNQAYFYGQPAYMKDYVIAENTENARLLEGLFAQKNSYVIEYKIKTPGGLIKWIHEKSFVIKNDAGDPVRLSGICSDITEKKEAEIAREQHQKVLALQKRILTQISTTPFEQYSSLQNCLQSINKAAAKGLQVDRVSIWDYIGTALICRDLYEMGGDQHSGGTVLHAHDFPAYFKGIQTGLAIVAADAYSNEYTFEFADTYLNPLGINAMLDVPVRIGGKLVGVVCCEYTGQLPKNWTEDDLFFARSIADIVSLALEADKRQQAEIALKKSQRAYEELVATIPVGVFKFARHPDGTNQLLYVSPRVCEIAGLSEEYLLRIFKVPIEIISPQDIPFFTRDLEDAVKYRKVFEWEGKILLHNETRVVHLEAFPQNSEDETLVWNGIMYDITDRKRAETELLATKERLESLIESIPDAIFFKDGAGKWLITNEAAKKVFQLENVEWLGKTDRQMTLINPALAAEYEICLENDEKTWQNGALSIFTEYFKDAHNIAREHEIRKMPVFYKDGSRKAMVIIGTDVTERRAVEQELQEYVATLRSTKQKLIATQIEQEKFVSLVKYSDAFIGIADMEGKAFFLNEKAKFMSGFGEDYHHTHVRNYHSKAARKLLKEVVTPIVNNVGIWRGEFDVVNAQTQQTYITDATMYVIDDPVTQQPIALATVQIDITERKQAERELIHAKQQAEAANRAKSEFLANMSHELRTPLNGVIGFTDLLMKTRLDSTQQEYMSLVYRSANTLLEVINDILDFSKIESGRLELDIQKTEVRAIGKQVLDVITYQAQQKNLAVLLTIDPAVPAFMWADGVRLKQVLINLLGNAVKFTATGTIELCVENLRSEKQYTWLRFSVKDTGIGIKPENRQKIFEAFSQEDTSTTRRFGGTGLGLAISKKLLGLMASELQLESEPGKGSTFYFDGMFKTDAADPFSGTVSTDSVLPTIPSYDRIMPDPQDLNTIQSGITILIAEDNAANMFLAKAIFRNILPSATLVEATNGLEAIEHFTRHRPDLIFMDVQMPEMNGHAATTAIRQLETDTRTPIIALTAGTAQEEKEKCFEAGMDDYISKPILPHTIEQVIKRWLFIPQQTQIQPLTMQPTTEVHFDLTEFQGRLGNNKTVMHGLLSLISEYLDTFPVELAQHIKAQNLPAIKAAGHSLKGTALSACLGTLSQQALQLQQLDDFEATTVQALFHEINTEITMVKQLITAQIEKI